MARFPAGNQSGAPTALTIPVPNGPARMTERVVFPVRASRWPMREGLSVRMRMRRIEWTLKSSARALLSGRVLDRQVKYAPYHYHSRFRSGIRGNTDGPSEQDPNGNVVSVRPWHNHG